MHEYGQSINLEYHKEASVCQFWMQRIFTGTVKGAENAESQRAISWLARGYKPNWAILQMKIE